MSSNSKSSSRRASKESSNSNQSASSNKSRLSLKGALDQFRPTTEIITPSGIYTPIIKKGPLFSGLRPAEKAQEPTPIYAGLINRDRPLFGRSKKNQTRIQENSVTSTRNNSLSSQSAVEAMTMLK